jgi:hypothetical protein
MSKRFLVLSFAVVVLLGALTPLAARAGTYKPSQGPNIRPVIYFHGSAGSAAQFEAQALRFASNGYPPEFLTSFEYSTAEPVPDKDAMNARLDAFIDDLLARTGAQRVDIIGKTWPGAYPPPSYPGITMEYMASSPERAAKIAHACYNDSALDGYTAIRPTLAIWGELGLGGRNMYGAENIILPKQTHVQTCTSAETFYHAYKFFTGEEPKTTEILPEASGRIELAGRAVMYQTNEGVQDATLEVWEVDGATGFRKGESPIATYQLSGDASWGPLEAKAGAYYEFALIRDGNTHHFYYEPFIRSDYLIRLTTSSLEGGIANFLDKSDRHSSIVVMRNKELLGDQSPDNTDTLTINGVSVCTPELCPLERNVIAFFAFDDGSDGVSNTDTIPFPFNLIHFMSGVDLFLPAVSPPDDSITLELAPRGGGGRKQVINVPNWASSTDRISVQFNDYLQDATSFYFAEGTTRAGFEEWLCLQNPNPQEAKAVITYMFTDGTTKEQEVTVKATSRETIDVNAAVGPEKDLSIKVESDLPILAERPMYFNYKGAWTGGHDVIGYTP